jgi:hypothetical protein
MEPPRHIRTSKLGDIEILSASRSSFEATARRLEIAALAIGSHPGVLEEVNLIPVSEETPEATDYQTTY